MKKLLTYLAIIGNAVISALIYQLFVFPNDFAPAGVGGICTMIQYVFGINVGYLSLLINLPLAIAVFFLVSKPEAFRSMLHVAVFSAALVVLDFVDLSAFEYHTETGTSSILGPLVGGLGMGYLCALMVRIGGHQGGVYFAGSLVHRFHPHFNMFWVSFALNVLVAVVSYFVYGMRIEPVLLCVIYCFATSLVNDKIAKGDRSAVRFEIITEHPDRLSQDIIHKLHHSATLLPGKGIYKGKETSVLICVVNNTQAATLSAIIRSCPDTFAVMSSVSEVMGNFKRLDTKGRQEVSLLDQGDPRI